MVDPASKVQGNLPFPALSAISAVKK